MILMFRVDPRSVNRVKVEGLGLVERRGFNTCPRYITIETGVKPKPYCEHAKNDRHKMIHTLLLCYESNWHELKFVKRRKSKVE